MTARCKKQAKRVALLALVAAAALPLVHVNSSAAQFQAVSGGDPVSPRETPAPRWPPRDRSKGLMLAISPQAEGKPALEFSLMPKVENTEKGNAATKYLQAISSLPPSNDVDWEWIDEARSSAPLAELNADDPKYKKLVEQYSFALRLFRDGAGLDGTDWEYNVRREGYKARLPSLGALRGTANVLALEIRFDIKKHDWAAANDKLRTGFALAKKLGDGETLIGSLVGTAVGAMLCQNLEEWVAEPGSPNLYWPLTNLPAPFCDMRRPMSFERATAFFSFPELKEMKAGHYSADLWTRMVGRLGEAGSVLDEETALPAPGKPAWTQQAASTGLGVMIYPQAKEYLIKRGMTREAVEKLPVYETLERYFVESYEEAIDDTFKWAGLPAAEAWKGMSGAEREFGRAAEQGDVNMLAKIFLPSVGRAMLLPARLDRQIAALRVVEAIRAHAAEKGTLPDKLEELKLPVPRDPVTGEAFGYAVADGKGVLTGRTVPETDKNWAAQVRIEITLRK